MRTTLAIVAILALAGAKLLLPVRIANDGAKFLCIYVSSKNSIGSYGSMHPATVSFKDGKVVDVDILNARNAVPCERRVRN